MFSKLKTVFVVMVLAAILVSSVGCNVATSTTKNEPTPTPIPPPPVPEKPTYTVKRGLVVDSLSFTGRVAPVVEEELFFRESGRVKTVYVERNDMVTAGTLLAELENDDLVRALAQEEISLETTELNLAKSQAANEYAVQKAKIQLDLKKLQLAKMEAEDQEASETIARLRLAQSKAGATPEEIEIARRQLEQAKNSLWSAQVSRDSTCGANKDSAACDSAQANVYRNEEAVRIAEIRVEQLLQGPDAEDMAIAEAEYRQKLADHAKAEIDIEMQRQQIALAELELANLETNVDPKLLKDVERGQLAVERLKAQLEKSRVESPIDGKVTSVSAYEGRDISAFKPVFVVADEAQLEVTAEPMSSQLQKLGEGMAAAIILSAYPGKELPGEILQLPYPYGGGGGANVEEADKLTHISFDPEDLDIEPGDLVKVLVTLEEKADALWLPPAAIRTFAGRKFVVIDDNGSQRRVDITVGIESAERVEIEDGLEEGQVVIGQ